MSAAPFESAPYESVAYESVPYDTDDRPVTVERREGPYGEVVLRRRGQGAGAVWEIIANGCFLMDTSDGRSERLLMRAALNALTEGVESGSGSDPASDSVDEVSAISTATGAPSLATTSSMPAASDELASVRGAEARCPIHSGALGGDSVDGSAAPGTSGTEDVSRPSSGRRPTGDGGSDSGLDGGREAGASPVRRSSQGVNFRPSVLIGGLGVGFSLVEAVAEPRWGRIVVAEREQAVIDWHLRGPLAELTGPALADPRTEILHTDLVAYLRGPFHDDADRVAAPSSQPDTDEHGFASRSEEPPVPTGAGEAIASSDSRTCDARQSDAGRRNAGRRYDALCLDIDNGPDWTVTEDNGGLYSPAGLAACREWLNPGGVLAIWSAQPSTAFEEALRNAGFTSVRTEEITVARGVPDVVHLAIRGA